MSVYVAAEVHQSLDRFGHERGRLAGVLEGVRACVSRIHGAGGIHVRLDHARVAVVDCAEDGDRSAVAARVPHEELSGRGVRDAGGARGGGRRAKRAEPVGAVAHPSLEYAFSAAWATVSLSANPVS